MIISGYKALMPPLGLITVAALCPDSWTVKVVDESVGELRDADIRWADIVFVSAMHVQRDGAHNVLQRARSLGIRTIIGGPYASSQPDVLLDLADHVVVGEPDEVFHQIAEELENGQAAKLYEIENKPDITNTPIPRFDLLELEKYSDMAIQFSRGCPFECEFCDIITIYGRKPRTKRPDQVIAELEALRRLGWRREVFIVDDNFIGNRKRALDLALQLATWQKSNDYPFAFYTEASVDLAQCSELIDAMVQANFLFVFIGIESPSEASLRETKKFQNLRQDLLKSVRLIHAQGLWVTGGFIVGFDSDDKDIFERQREFIGSAAIPWAMLGFLIAPPTTPLFDRMNHEGRLIADSISSNFSPPNFRTKMPLLDLLGGFRDTLASLYRPDAFFDRALRSLRQWESRQPQTPPHTSVARMAGIVARSIWYQGIRSRYARSYWKFLFQFVYRWARNPPKLYLGFVVLISSHHFLRYAIDVVSEVDDEIRRVQGTRSALNRNRQKTWPTTVHAQRVSGPTGKHQERRT